LVGVTDQNDQSLTSRFKCDGHSWLLLGDLSVSAQEEIVKNYPDWQSEVVKISHHGSDDGINEEVLSSIGAKYAIIQVGKDNKFGHPSRRTLKKLERLNLKTFRTDQLGTINMISKMGKMTLRVHEEDLPI
jgi:competence protein ComEC